MDEHETRQTIRDAFDEFHGAHPEVLEQLRRRALRAQRRGYRPGIKALFEVLRWGHGMARKADCDEFKLNNNYTAHYARLLMETTPELAGFFETRAPRSQWPKGSPDDGR